MTPGSGTSTTQSYPSALASGGSHGDDVGQYSTVEDTKKPWWAAMEALRGGLKLLVVRYRQGAQAALPELEPVRVAA
jgi:hypothetical protein